MRTKAGYKIPLHPKTWPTWLGFGVWWLLTWTLPRKTLLWMGVYLGRFAMRVSKRRTHIARTNIDACFPEKTQAERDAILRESMESIGKGFFEFGLAWFGPISKLNHGYTIEGLEYIEQAQANGEGVLLIGFHFLTLEIGAALISLNVSVDGFYQPHKNPVYEFVMKVGRERHNKQGVSFQKNDLRGVIRSLRKGRAVIYLNDQDLGPKRSEFVPFFGIQTATVLGTSQLLRAGKARALFNITGRNDDGTYFIKFVPPPKPLGQGDDFDDAKIINDFAEKVIRQQPEQYLWAHRRFKTRPEGEPPFYKM